MKIHSPVKGFSGRTTVGAVTLEFEDGVADFDGKLPDGVRRYLKDRGYGLGSSAPAEPEAAPEPPDPREVGAQQVGSRLRDAAVDPRPGDFLAPTNAGEANPHGPDVVSPEIHAAQGTRPVKPGEVHVDDVDAQDEAETEHTEQSTDGTPVDDGPEQPAGNASTDEWRAYARARAQDSDEAAAIDGLSRDELREKYGTKAEA